MAGVEARLAVAIDRVAASRAEVVALHVSFADELASGRSGSSFVFSASVAGAPSNPKCLSNL